MLTITSTSLSGGQGKTTLVYFLAKKLALLGYRVLAIDLDPQANLSTYFRVILEPDDFSCLEFLKGNFERPQDCIYPVASYSNLYLIPADDGLEEANNYLSSSGFGAIRLKNQIKQVKSNFDFCLIDTPPQKSQLCQTGIGAADYCCLPVEVKSKGVISLQRTIEAIELLKESGIVAASLLAVLPFRDRWVGFSRTSEGQKAFSQIEKIVDKDLLLPPWRESVKTEKAVNQGVVLEDLEEKELSYPFDILIQRLEALI